MLRITERKTASGQVALALEGRLIGPWVDELERIVGGSSGANEALRLNLASVTFVDRRGALLLRQWALRGVQLENPSSFVAELLDASSLSSTDEP